MKIIADRRILSDLLAHAMKVVPGRSPKPAMQCVRLEARPAGEEGAGLTVWASNGELWLRQHTERVEVSEAGNILVRADKLAAIVKESIDSTVTLIGEGDVLIVKGSDSKFKVFGQPVNDLPMPAEEEGGEAFALPAGTLGRMLAQTAFCTAQESSRYATAGVLLDWKRDGIVAVATDGHRMSKATSDDAPDAEGRALVPIQAVNLLQGFLTDAEETIEMWPAPSRMRFKIGDRAEVFTLLLEGDFPPYADVIPKAHEVQSEANVDRLVSALRRAALLTSEQTKGVRFAFGAESLELSSRTPEMGEAEVTMEPASYAGDALEIGFDPRYVADGLKAMTGEVATLKMTAANKPMTMEEPGFLYVIMPLNLT